MKKIVALLTAVFMIMSFTGCGTKNNSSESAKSDLEYIKDKGTLVVGITNFAPMDYKDDDGNWIGFDADNATAFAKKLGVKVEFIEINWDNKIMELNSKSIDCVWNGMTLTDEITNSMATSNAYCKNAQVVVVPKDKADNYKTADDIKSLSIAVETGSAGEEAVKELGCNYTSVDSQADALMEVSAGTSNACVIDLLMAGAMIGEGTSYENLAYTVSLNSEEYGVGFRKGSDLVNELNTFFEDAKKDGSLLETAKKYGVQDSLINK